MLTTTITRSVCLYLNHIGKKGVPVLDQILRESAPVFKIANFQVGSVRG